MTTATIKAIETRYDNILFRSRIEARWAYLFKSLRLRYIYEPERFDMRYHGSRFIYMPDFYLIDLNCYVEVKGKKPNQREKNVAWVLSNSSGCLVHLVCGQMPFPYVKEWDRFDFISMTFDSNLTRFPHPSGVQYALNSCVKCGRVEFVPDGDRSLISCGHEVVSTSKPTRKIASAFIHARMERFDRRRYER